METTIYQLIDIETGTLSGLTTDNLLLIPNGTVNSIGASLQYRGQIFTTDQTDYPNYQMTKDQYSEPDDDNNIIYY